MYHLSIPKDLRGHLPRVVGEFGTSKTLLLLGYGGIAVLLYAITNFNNGWLYTVPTLLGPLLSSLFLMVRPLNPYKSLYARLEGMEDLDTRGNRAAEWLVALL